MAGLPDEVCAVCGFSPELYDLESDIHSTLGLIATVVGAAIEGLTDEQINTTFEDVSIAALVASAEATDASPMDAVHHGLHTVALIGDQRLRMGAGSAAGTGQVVGLFRSDGGVPKTSIDTADITGRGVGGDRQADRKHHGRPLQALCLWSQEVIGALQEEGHRIGPGLAGENITVAGLEWASLRPGSRLSVGEVDVLISADAVPCAKNAQWFIDRNFT